MQIYLPIAEMSVPAEQIFLLSSFVGFLSGALGVGGGFLTTPFLIFMGISPSVAVGTQATQLVASSTAGALGHFKRNAVDVRIGVVMLLGGFLGSLLGALLFDLFEKSGKIDFIISYLYIFLLGGIGLSMSYDIIQSLFFPKSFIRREFNAFRVNSLISKMPLKMRFPRSKLYISAFVPMGIGMIGGVLATLLGIGGGFILVPAMIYVLGMPTLLVAGTSLFQMIFTTGFAVIMHATFNNTVDIVLGSILILGGVIGAQAGISISPFLKDIWARLILIIMVLGVCLTLCLDVFFEPSELFSVVHMMEGQ